MNSTAQKPHQAFSGLQNDYRDGRPAYPDEAMHVLSQLVPKPDPVSILDVGCGTGIFTRQLAKLYPDSLVTGCDPNADMIGEAARKSPDVQFVGAPAEALPFDSLSFGLITAAQAAQWFDRPVFYREVHRLLRAGGAVALIENNRNWHKSEFFAEYEKLLEAGKSGYSRHYRDHDYAAELAAAGFDAIEQIDCQWVRRVSAPTFLTMARSSTQVQAANRAMGPSFEARLSQLIESYSHNGDVDVDYLTRLWVGFSPGRPAPT